MQKLFFASSKMLLLMGFLSLIVFWPALSRAESYDIFVDDSFEKEGNGSSDKPFSSFKDAIKEAKAGDKIFIRKGNYKGDLTVPASVSFYGESRDGVVIEGPMVVSDGFYAKDISFSGGYTTITVKAGASIKLENCVVKNSLKMGINILPGNGKLVVRNSKIYGNAKGFYVQMGNQFQLTNSEVYKNGEEGIDLRNDNDGFIQGNEIYDNGESGIEIILGKTDMLISGNKIKNNRASGIATQFYPDFNDSGRLIVKNNTISGNDNHGVKCGIPQGGSGLTRTYWQESIEVENNVFGGNGKGDIESRCKILTDKEKAEIERLENEVQEKAEILKAQKIAAEKTEEQRRIEEEGRIEKEEKAVEAFREQAISLEIEWKSLEVDMDQKIELLKKRNRFSFWLFGPKKEKIEEVENDLNGGKQKLSKMQEIVDLAPTDETKSELQDKIISLNQAAFEKESLLEDWKKDLSFWNRTKNIFSRK